MSKLYISYYGDFVSIVDGFYKKNKFNINDTLFMSSSDIDVDYSDKYKLLKEALSQNQYKTKKAVLCLNTLDVIVKSNKIAKVSPEDLDSLMYMEIDEQISLERDQYEFSYEVMREFEEQGQEWLDLVLAGIEKTEIKEILKIFEEFNLKLEYIDILPAAYSRVLNVVEYTDMMIVNTSEYSTAIDIYKEDSLYIHDNVPVRLSKDAQPYDYMRLVDEANGLMNYYSSRNFGKIVDSILLIGNHAHNGDIVQNFKNLFSSSVISGIENLYDIYTDIKGNVSEEELNMIVEIIGCMMREEEKSPYLRMNLLPEEIKIKNRQKEKAVKALKILPIAILIMYTPILGFDVMDILNNDKLSRLETQISEIEVNYKKIDEIEEDIKSKEDEIKIYDGLIEKEPRWGQMLTSIDQSIPYQIFLEKLSLSYVPDGDSKDTEENKESSKENQSTEEAIYDKIPNTITMSGIADTPTQVGQFIYKLNELPYFEDIKLPGVTENKGSDDNNSSSTYSFSIIAKVKEGGVVDG